MLSKMVSKDVDPFSNKSLEELMQKIGVRLKRRDLLKSAITTKAAKNENMDVTWEDNERLSFLGDSVLKTCLSIHLYKETHDTRSMMTLKRALVERNSFLAGVARKLYIKPQMFLGGAQVLDVKGEDRILADCMEALIGACYIDKKELDSALTDRVIDEIQKYDNIDLMDPISRIQQFFQMAKGELPEYVYSKSGSDHDPVWTASLEIDGERLKATGSSQREVRRLVAEKALMKIKLENLI